MNGIAPIRLCSASMTLIAALALVACAADSSGTESLPSYEASSDGGDMALLTGTLSFAEDCLFVVNDEGASVVPVFPRGTATWNGEVLAVTTSIDNVSGRIADTVELAGGYRDEWPGSSPIPAGCSAEALYFQVAA